MDMRGEIAVAAQRAGLTTADLRVGAPFDYERILVDILERFTRLGKAGLTAAWWWEHFRPPVTSRHISDGWLFLDDLIPDDDRVWFVAEDGPGTKREGNFWLYDAKPAALRPLLGEMYRFEFYVVSKKLEWLLARNHHDAVFAVGDRAIAKLEAFEPESREQRS